MSAQGVPIWPAGINRTTLIQCLGMIGSAHDGEALNAARLADRMVRNAGRTWANVISPQPASNPLPQSNDLFRDWPTHWRWVVCMCLESDRDFRDFDRKFLRNLVAWASTPSAAQLRVLREVADRLLAKAAAV
jgi:hypothetical protein